MENNATLIYGYLKSKGWADNPIYAVLGNMQSESTINSGIWESLKVQASSGFGFVQWTPSTNYTNWAKANGYAIDNPIGQLYWIDQLSGSSGQWIKTGKYNLTWEQFKKSTNDEQWLASAFLKNFERAGVEVENARRRQATEWKGFLTGTTPVPPPYPEPHPTPSPFGWDMLELAVFFKMANSRK